MYTSTTETYRGEERKNIKIIADKPIGVSVYKNNKIQYGITMVLIRGNEIVIERQYKNGRPLTAEETQRQLDSGEAVIDL